MRDAEDKGAPLLLMSNAPGEYKSKSPSGIYDDTLVCEECEGRFSESDTYAINFLLNEKNFIPLLENGLLAAWSSTYDYKLLKFFFLALLWRIGATNHPFFKAVNLGPHLSTLRDLILANSAGSYQDYSVFLGRYEDELGRSIIMNPHIENRKTFNGLNFYRFHLGSGYIAFIKVDSRPYLGIFEKLFLTDKSRTLYIINRGKFSERKELDIAIDILKKNKA